jgi:cytoskeletal protein CcmA (bactofilin family)
MSCPSPEICLLYAEGELVGPPLRETEAHLITCLDCRTRVMALREESRLLGEVLRGERLHAAAPVAEDAPGRSLALGVPLAIAAAAAALAVAGAVLDARLPGALDLLDPRRLKGAVEMSFDVIFMLREHAPGLFELGFAVGVMASISALLSFGVSALSRRWFGGTAALILALAGGARSADALLVASGEEYHVAAGERVADTVLTRGAKHVDIDGAIQGDLIAMAERVTVRGEVAGTLYVFCRQLELTGSVGGAIVVAETTRIEGTVRGNVYLLGEDVALTSTAQAQGDVTGITSQLVVEGKIARDLYVNGERLDLRGAVGRNLSSHWLEQIVLRDGSSVSGDVDVQLAHGSTVERAAGARVGGAVRAAPIPSPREHYLDHYKSWRFYAVTLLWFTAAFVFGLIVYRIAPRVFRNALANGTDLWRALATGFVVLVVMPVAILAAACTIVGIPAAVAALFLYVMGLYTADLVVGAWLGTLLAPPANDSLLAFGRSFAIGLAVLTAVTLVPFLGPAVSIVVMLLGLGLLAARAREALR